MCGGVGACGLSQAAAAVAASTDELDLSQGLIPGQSKDPPGRAGTGKPDPGGVQEQHHHHPGVGCHFPTRILVRVEGVTGLKTELSGPIQKERHQVILRQPLHRCRWEEQALLGLAGPKGPGLDHSACRAENMFSHRDQDRLGSGCGGLGRWSMCNSLLTVFLTEFLTACPGLGVDNVWYWRLAN